MEVSGVDRCSLAGDNGFQETGHWLFPTEARSIQSGDVGANGENEGKVEIFLEREEVSGEWMDILVVKRGEEREEEKEASDRNVSRLRIKVIAFAFLHCASLTVFQIACKRVKLVTIEKFSDFGLK